jgi:hypothetical protein
VCASIILPPRGLHALIHVNDRMYTSNCKYHLLPKAYVKAYVLFVCSFGVPAARIICSTYRRAYVYIHMLVYGAYSATTGALSSWISIVCIYTYMTYGLHVRKLLRLTVFFSSQIPIYVAN